LYARVSTRNGQTTQNQVRELKAVAKRAGWQVVAVYQDEGISGSKGRDQRPGLDAALKAAARREFDVLAAWSVDRLGRSLTDLLGTLKELHGVGCDLYLHTQGLDTRTPAGKAMFGMMGVFAEFERAIIQERIAAGLARARAEGKHLGRPATDGDGVERARAALARGASLRQAAQAGGVGLSVVRRLARQRRSA
jgi:DNA invertase Pin-like site-specific DNA recombinase